MPTDVTLPDQLPPFLSDAGWDGAAVAPLAGDASFRRYFRVSDGSRRKAMLMHAPPPHEDPRPFMDVTAYLLDSGFRAPAIYAADAEQGFLLLEDFGDRRMREHVDAHAADEAATYRQAVDTLVALAQAPVASVSTYDEAVYLREAGLLTEWYLPAMGIDANADVYDGLWAKALAPVYEAPKATVLRDYHAENIMLLDDGGQGLIDYQDALVGHPAYDLVSILQDARRDVAPALEAAMLEHYQMSAQPDYDFALHYALLGAQRNAKIIGIFTRLWQRDGKARYLDFLPRMWGLLERDLAHPGLSEIRQWFDMTIPADIRARSPLDRAA
jgi:N-acetylmuramate 1-kinase